MRNENCVIEVCITSVEDAMAACAGGADRLELNIGMEVGGLTPSIALLQEVRKAVDLPVVTMVRPRAAGFRYSAIERRVMIREAELLMSHGADGIVAGAQLDDGNLDREFWNQLRRLTEGKQLIYHRAFDVALDQRTLLEQLIDSGTTRILTSGGCETAWEGRKQIASLQKIAQDRIELLPGSGVCSSNAAALIRETGCNQVHGSFRELRIDPAGLVAQASYPVTSETKVAETREALDTMTPQ